MHEATLKVTIIGSGFCGTMLAVQLLRRAKDSVEVTLVDQTGRFGPGIAYHPGDDQMILNVPVQKMGALPESPESFFRWAEGEQIQPAPREGAYLPRSLYAQYLDSILRGEMRQLGASSRLKLIRAEAIEADTGGVESVVRLRDGRELRSEAVVFALGNLPARSEYSDLPEELYSRDPWRSNAWRRVLPTRSVLLIGAGLTAIDVISTYVRAGHRGKILCVSRHGLLARVRKEVLPAPAIDIELFQRCATVRELHRALRAESVRTDSWQAVIDAIRPHVPDIWRGLPTKEKRRFISHSASIWNAHCHRMPPQAAELLAPAVASSLLQMKAARLVKLSPDGERIVAILRPRGQSKTEAVAFDHVIDCRGSPDDLRRAESPLVEYLFRTKQIAPHPCGLGLHCDESGYRLRNPSAGASRAYTLGNALRGERWESTAVPQLRGQTEELAELILDRPT